MSGKINMSTLLTLQQTKGRNNSTTLYFSGNSKQSNLYNATSGGIIFFEVINNCLEKNNFSTDEQFRKTFEENIEMGDLFIHFLAFIGNLVSLIVLARRNIMGPRMTQLLCLLTFSEVLYTGLSFMAELVEHIAPPWLSIYLEIVCKVCSHSFLSQRNWWIVVIGCVRYLVIARPLQMKRSVFYTSKALNTVFGIFLLSWLVESIGLTCYFRVLVEQCNDTNKIKVKVWALHNTKSSYRFVEGTAVFMRTFLPTILVSLFSFLTLHKLYWNSSVNQRKLSAATRTIFLLTMIFAVCELPYGLTFIFCLLPPGTANGATFLYYSGVGKILVALDSMCNIVVYCVSSPQYRSGLVRCLHLKSCCCCQDDQLLAASTLAGTGTNKQQQLERVESEYGELEENSSIKLTNGDHKDEGYSMMLRRISNKS